MRIYSIEEKNNEVRDSQNIYGFMSKTETKPIVAVSFEFDSIEQAHKYYELMNKELDKQNKSDKREDLKSQIKVLQKELKEVK